ncbi:MAG: tRNA-2-methylthio-N6-dimethylallyladenosine synthase [Saprospiraceae bacterium]|jgi:tRNA-2-methylthio-N6-dimethylallyladenosine synthase
MQNAEKEIDETRQGEVLSGVGDSNSSKKMYIESYGCQMNFSDSEIAASVLSKDGYTTTNNIDEADVVFLNTCSIRDNAEVTIKKRLQHIKGNKRKNPNLKVGILGCMAERLKSKLLEEEKLVDLVAGPDAYRDLPNLMDKLEDGNKSVNVQLSRDETYSDIDPVRINSNGITAFISIMRGCDNMCTFCVVPFTRGRERSRDPKSIMDEANKLYANGYKEITLLGQNVDSYRWSDDENLRGKSLKEAPRDEVIDFSKLLEMVAEIAPDFRIRFTTSHPKDITDDVLYSMKKYDNICKYIHLPAQSGNSRILQKMNRTYTREWYLDKVDTIRKIIPGCAISTDIITGFCSETDEEHKDSVSLMKEVVYDYAYMFFYSERPGTLAAKKFEDDVPLITKKSRLTEIINIQTENNKITNNKCVGNTYEVLIEKFSKKSDKDLMGRNSHYRTIVFPAEDYKAGEYVNVKIVRATGGTLIGEAVSKVKF